MAQGFKTKITIDLFVPAKGKDVASIQQASQAAADMIATIEGAVTDTTGGTAEFSATGLEFVNRRSALSEARAQAAGQAAE